MSVYRIRHAGSYQYLGTLNEDESQKFPLFNGKSLRDKWKDIPTQLFTEEHMNLDGDFPYFLYGGVLVCSARAWDHLKSLISNEVEHFQLNCVNCTDRSFYALNVLNVIDCLDYSRSKIDHFKTGRIKSIQNMTFLPNCYRSTNIFKIPEWILSDVFVTQEFKATVEHNNLKGLIFTKIEE